MTVWMYYETDGDAGYYRIKLFKTEQLAEQYKKRKHDAYGGIKRIEVAGDAAPSMLYSDAELMKKAGLAGDADARPLKEGK